MSPPDLSPLNMPPSDAIGDLPDDRCGHAVGAAKFVVGRAGFKLFADRSYLPLRQECVPVLTAALEFFRLRSGRIGVAACKAFRMQARAIAITARGVVATLSDAIDPVLLMRSAPKVPGIAAWRVIAAMQHQASFSVTPAERWQLDTVMQLVSNAVRALQTPRPPNNAIPARAEAQLPRPAFIGTSNIDVGPKVLWRVPIPGGAYHA